MKVVFALMLAFAGSCAWAQREIPSLKIKDVNGKTVSTDVIANDGKPFVLSFWATWCKPCIQELNAIHEHYEDWKNETGVRVFAVSIDDARNSPKVAPFVQGRGWDFDVFIDENSDFKRAMNVNNVPHTFVFNGSGKIVSQHTSFVPGDE
ncbi:MAG: TlpA family protein disulfide reductase, partial [Bacteroidia bacterium]|nr:TlpA family protein disulfide reductase [Bacteroidia bacterium]